MQITRKPLEIEAQFHNFITTNMSSKSRVYVLLTSENNNRMKLTQ